MSKIIAIGDTHGHNEWQHIVEKEKDADKIVFLGDYFDSFNIPHHEQMENFLKIVAYKNENPDKVVLLLGNHDFQYLTQTERYSGFQEKYADDIGICLYTLVKNGAIKICHKEGKYLFTHAGVTKTWCKKHKIDLKDIEKSLNKKLIDNPTAFYFQGIDPTGNDVTQSPIWVRPESLCADSIDGYNHIIGHTRVKIAEYMQGKKSDIFLIDTMDHSQEYIEIVDDKMTVKR